MTQITQMKVSNILPLFKNNLLLKNKLSDYKSITEPSFFYGIYSNADLNTLVKHKGPKIIIWSGMDIYYRFNKKTNIYLKIISGLSDVYHVANSYYISKDLDELKIKYKKLPICGININTFHPIRKNKSIYVYTNPLRPLLYGSKYYEKLIKMLPNFHFILACNKIAYNRLPEKDKKIYTYVDKKNINSLYSKCFIGLRLTRHDGIAYTVLELGLSGIKCVHNGDQPNALHFKGIRDIINIINKQYATIGTIDYGIVLKTRKYLNIDKRWKFVKYYKN